MAQDIPVKAQELTILAELSEKIRENETQNQVEIGIHNVLGEPSSEVTGDTESTTDIVTDVKAGVDREIGPDGIKGEKSASYNQVENEQMKIDRKDDIQAVEEGPGTYLNSKRGKDEGEIPKSTETKPECAIHGANEENEIGEFVILS